ncbi:Apoptosis-inducing factor 3 [Chlorella vulgaris]
MIAASLRPSPLCAGSRPSGRTSLRVQAVWTGTGVKDFDLGAAGGKKVVEIGGQRILLATANGEVKAVSNKCPHLGLPLVGKTALLQGEVANGCVTCPAHGSKFDLSTGEPVGEWIPKMPSLPFVGKIGDTPKPLPTFEARVGASGEIEVNSRSHIGTKIWTVLGDRGGAALQFLLRASNREVLASGWPRREQIIQDVDDCDSDSDSAGSEPGLESDCGDSEPDLESGSSSDSNSEPVVTQKPAQRAAGSSAPQQKPAAAIRKPQSGSQGAAAASGRHVVPGILGGTDSDDCGDDPPDLIGGGSDLSDEEALSGSALRQPQPQPQPQPKRAPGAPAKGGAGKLKKGPKASAPAGPAAKAEEDLAATFTAVSGINAVVQPDGSVSLGPPPGAGSREDRQGSRQRAQPSPAAQSAAAQQQRARGPAAAKVEQLVPEVADDKLLSEALRLEEEQRRLLRKQLGLDDAEEAEAEDPVLGDCALSLGCSKENAVGLVRASHAERYEFRCSAGHRLLYHQPCWRKETVRMVDAKGGEEEVVGKDFKFGLYKKHDRKKCVRPGCEGTLVFIEGPNKYPILNIEEQVKKEEAAAAPAHQQAAEAPEWELYNQQQQQQKEKRFKFKKGKGRKADEEEEEEDAAPVRTTCRNERRLLLQQQHLQHSQDHQQPETAEGHGSAADAATEGEQLSTGDAAAAAAAGLSAAPALPDDKLLRAIERREADADLLGLGGRRKAKEKGRAAAKDCGIEYGDGGKADKRKKKGVKMVLEVGLTIAEQRRTQLETGDGIWEGPAKNPNRLGASLMDFPDLEEAEQIAKLERLGGEDAEHAARDLYSSALLTALRSFKADVFRPDDPNGPCTVLVENIDYRRMADQDARPEISTFAEYGSVKALQQYPACKAAVVSFRSTQAAYQAYLLLPQMVLLHSRLTAMLLARLPGEQEVEELARQVQEEARLRAGGWEEEEEDEEALGDAASGSSSSQRAPLYAIGNPAASRPSSGPGGSSYPTVSITISGAAASVAAPGSRVAALLEESGAGGGSGGSSLNATASAYVPASLAASLGTSLGTVDIAVDTAVDTVCTEAGAEAGNGLSTATTVGFDVPKQSADVAAHGSLRVAASEFRPQQATAQQAVTSLAPHQQQPEEQQEEQQEEEQEEEQQQQQQQQEQEEPQLKRDLKADPLVTKYFAGQLIATDKAAYQMYLEYADEPFGLSVHTFDKVGLVTKDSVALLMFDIESGLIYGVWAAQSKDHFADMGEVVSFRADRTLPPLPLHRVAGLLQWDNLTVKLPQKLPAATIQTIMLEMVEQEQAQIAQAEQAKRRAAAAEEQRRKAVLDAACAAGAAARPVPAGASPSLPKLAGIEPAGGSEGEFIALPPHLAAKKAQEERDAELARKMQEQLIAEAQLEQRQRLAEDAHLARYLHPSAAAGTGSAPAAPFGYAAAAAKPGPPPPPAAAGPRPPGLFASFSSLFPGQRPQGAPAARPAPPPAPHAVAPAAAGPAPVAPAAAAPVAPVAAAPAAAAAVRPPPMWPPAPRGTAAAAAPRPYRPMAGYRPPLAAAGRPSAAAAPAAAAAAPLVPATFPPASASPSPAATTAAAAPAALAAAAAASPAAAAEAAPALVAAAAAPAAAAALKNPCVACQEREAVNLWIPCGHHGHCPECLPDSMPLPEKLAQFPKCLTCGTAAQYYIRMFS